jgi:hypothetical protein
MKKIALLVLIALFSSTLFAQHAPVWGIKGGLNLSNWKVEGNSETEVKTGIHVGGLAHIHLAPQWALQPEVQFSAQGAESTVNDNEFIWKMNYINVPVMAQYMFDNGFRIEAGPYAGFLINGTLEDEDGNEDKVTNEFKKTDFGLGFGLNYLTYSGFGFGGRYNLGLTNINEERVNETRNRVFQVSVFYMFDNAHKAKSR